MRLRHIFTMATQLCHVADGSMEVKERLRARAKRNSRALSAETQAILSAAIERDVEDRRIARRLREMSRPSDL